MGVIVSKAPNPRITDVNDAQYTRLNDFDVNGLKSIVGGQDFIAGGINTIGRLNIQLKNFIRPLTVLDQAVVGDIAMVGNRVGVITAVAYDGLTPNTIEALTVHERNIPQRNAAVAQDLTDDNMIGQSGRKTEYTFGVVDATGDILETVQFSSGTTTHTLLLGSITVMKQPTLDPSSWNPIAQAIRKFAGTIARTVSITAFTDGGTTPAGNTDVTFTSLGDGSVITSTMASGIGTAVLEPGVTYEVKDGDGSAAEVQETGSTFFTPADTADAQPVTLWNYVAV